MRFTAYREPHCLYIRLIILLNLWAEITLQSLNPFTLQLYIYNPIGRNFLQCLNAFRLHLKFYFPYGLYEI